MDHIVQFGIGGLAIVMVAIIIALVWVADRRAFPSVFAAVAVMMAIQFGAAESGVLREWVRTPPPFAVMMVVTLGLTIILAFSRAGNAMIRNLPLAVLVAFQVFRLPLELMMHRAALDGIMPNQMSFSGLNFDILSGILALPVAWMAKRGNHAVVAIWNVGGSILLAAIVTIAFISTPRIAAFGPEKLNTFVADVPYVWLPGVLVPCALLGHLLVWRQLSKH